MLARAIYYNEKEQIQRKRPPSQEESKGSPGRKAKKLASTELQPPVNKVFFPIRGIDFDPSTNTLYTGDEAGYMQKWDLNLLLGKLKEVENIQNKKIAQEKEAQNLIRNATLLGN